MTFIVSILWAWGFFLFANFFRLTVNGCVINKYLLMICCLILLKISSILKLNSHMPFDMNRRLACIVNSNQSSVTFMRFILLVLWQYKHYVGVNFGQQNVSLTSNSNSYHSFPSSLKGKYYTVNSFTY